MNFKCHAIDTAGDPEGDRQIKQYLKANLYPVNAPENLYVKWNRKLSIDLLPKLKSDSKIKTLRELAREHGISYESIRMILKTGK
jgi:hypothetical protein